MIEVERSATVAAPPEEVWAVLADFDGIARWAPNVDHACLQRDGGDGIGCGTVRRVQTGRTTLLETIDDWVAGERLGYRIDGLAPVIRHAHNTWRITPTAIGTGTGTEVSLTTAVDAGPRPPRQVVARLVGRRMAAESESMLAGLTRAASQAGVRDQGAACG